MTFIIKESLTKEERISIYKLALELYKNPVWYYGLCGTLSVAYSMIMFGNNEITPFTMSLINNKLAQTLFCEVFTQERVKQYSKENNEFWPFWFLRNEDGISKRIKILEEAIITCS